MSKNALICGAGRIGRGFLGQLLHRSGYQLYFLDHSETVVRLLNEARRYRVDIAGLPSATEYVPVQRAFSMREAHELRPILNSVSLLVSSVGASNISSLVNFLRPLLEGRDPTRLLNWLICENADHPAQTIRTLLTAQASATFQLFCQDRLGLIETQILRTGMSADAELLAREPLALRMQDWWTLPADAEAFRGSIPEIMGLQPKPQFENELMRKVFTFNGLNGPISYLGYQRGYRILHQAALAPEMQEILRQILEESGHGLVREFGFDLAEHRQFQELAWNKYRNFELNDQIERNAQDLGRTLGPHERLIGPATFCLKHGRPPLAYATAIAAAIHYNGSSDLSTLAVQKTLQTQGVDGVMENYCQLSPASELGQLIKNACLKKSFLPKAASRKSG
jgi:mannitol-1-phosphate 5-dehydrogenase